MSKVLLILVASMSFFLAPQIQAEEENGSTPQADQTAAVAPVPSRLPSKSSKRGRIVREKEAEGTQAPNRFDTELIIKSRYELNGQALEVDTD